MRVNVYRILQDGSEIAERQGAWLDDVMGDDAENLNRAQNELSRSGRVWVGGGGAPMFLLFAVRP